MPSKKETKRIIDTAFFALSRACDSSTEARRLCKEAERAAIEGQRNHRKFTRGLNYAQSVKTAARYFVAHWFCESQGRLLTAREACGLRRDCLLTRALRECLDAGGKQVDVSAAANLDYCADIIGL